jgi:ABC-type uncharacterized transport system YnjBCD ATPase subunit
MRTPVLELEDVTFRRAGTQILHGVSFTVGAGEHWALLGPNGAGKSTVLGFCGAVTHPTTGVVRVLGGQLGRVELQALRRSIGHVNPRHPLRSPLTVQDVVLTGLTGSIELPPRWTPGADQLTAARDLLDVFGLAGKAQDRWPTPSPTQARRRCWSHTTSRSCRPPPPTLCCSRRVGWSRAVRWPKWSRAAPSAGRSTTRSTWSAGTGGGALGRAAVRRCTRPDGPAGFPFVQDMPSGRGVPSRR